MTGARGFIGSRLVAELSFLNFEVVVVDLRAGNLDDVQELDVLVHLAAVTPQKMNGRERGIKELNLETTRAALGICERASCPLVFISSHLYRYLGEGGVAEDSELDLRSEYREAKRLCELECEKHFEAIGLPVTVLRMANVFGPGQGSQFLIPSLIQQVIRGGPVCLKSRDTTRDFLFVDDAVSAIKLSLDQLRGLQYYNVGSGRASSVSEVLDLIEQKLEVKPTRVWGESDGGGDSSPLNFSKISDQLGWKPLVGLSDGIARTIDNFVIE